VNNLLIKFQPAELTVLICAECVGICIEAPFLILGGFAWCVVLRESECGAQSAAWWEHDKAQRRGGGVGIDCVTCRLQIRGGLEKCVSSFKRAGFIVIVSTVPCIKVGAGCSRAAFYILLQPFVSVVTIIMSSQRGDGLREWLSTSHNFLFEHQTNSDRPKWFYRNENNLNICFCFHSIYTWERWEWGFVQSWIGRD
jgi:hypothetical protein